MPDQATASVAHTAGPCASPFGMGLGARLGELPQNFIVEVTRDDIRWAVRESANLCPIARAVRRTLSQLGCEVFTLDVSAAGVSIMPRNFAKRVEFWHDRRRFVMDFDEGRHVEPCPVTLRRLAS